MPRYQTSEEWERKRSYLNRTLYQHIPLFSPIQEEPESILSLINNDLKRDSPLPDLIIEIEPKKRNLCDETDEFYEKLAKEMRRLYKRDNFSASLSTDTLESLNEFERNEEHIKILTEPNSPDGSNSSRVLQDLEIINTKGHTNFGPDKNIHSDQIQIQCDKNSNVEDAPEVTGERYSKTKSPTESYNKSERKFDKTSRHHIVDIEEEKEEEEAIEKDNESLAVNCDASGVMNNSETPSQLLPDIIRQPHYVSLESLPARDISTSDSDGIGYKSNDIQPMIMEEAVASSGSKEVARSPSYLNKISSTSIPKAKIVTRKYRNRSPSYFSSFHSRKSASAQASFSDEDPDWSMFWNELFVGKPNIKNVCSCKNHICS